MMLFNALYAVIKRCAAFSGRFARKSVVTCPACHGEGHYCDVCDGTGAVLEIAR